MLALVVFFGALGSAATAAAEPRPGTDRSELRRQLADLQRRARELDEKIRRVENQLAREAPARTGAAPAAAALATNCLLPFYLDSTGIKHLRPECAELTAKAPCDPPYRLNEQGVRHFLPACTTAAAAPGKRVEE
jgi:hypothetical protein